MRIYIKKKREVEEKETEKNSKRNKDTNRTKTKINGETKIEREHVSCFNFPNCKLDPNEERNRESEKDIIEKGGRE